MKRLRHPVRSIQEPFGKAGLIVACLALVFAMAGGAFAAKGALTKKESREVAKIARKEAKKFAKQGPKGNTGPAGPQGPAGAKGDTGAKGDNGSNGSEGAAGADGKSVVAFPISPSEPACEEQGGTEFEVEGSGTVETVCNGKQGKNGTFGEGTLGEGVTETGTWNFTAGGATGERFMTISFPTPLASELEEPEVTFDEPGPGDGCGGNAIHPLATTAPGTLGHLCIYTQELIGATTGEIGEITFGRVGASEFGAVVSFEATSASAYGWGSWALSGPKAP